MRWANVWATGRQSWWSEQKTPWRKNDVAISTGEKAMFDTLEEHIANEQTTRTLAERAVRYLVVAAVSVVLFGALFCGVWLLEY